MKRRLATVLLLAGLAAGTVWANAQASITDPPGNGNPPVNPAGNCPPGHLPPDAPPGAIKKC